MALTTRFGALTGIIAAVSMASTPAFAADLPSGLTTHPTQGSATFVDFNSSTYDNGSDVSEYRRGRGRFGRRGFRRHRRGIRGGDVLAGVLILGGIAAVASAANNNRRRQRDVVIVERERDRDFDRRDNRRITRNDGASGLENAVSQCVDRIQQDIRVDSVDSVNRTSQGWLISGSLFNGSGFTCQIGNDGRIADIDYGSFSGASSEGSADSPAFLGNTRAEGQWSDARYADARAAINDTRVTAPQLPRGEAIVPVTAQGTPAYPGGPVVGDIIPETRAEIDGDLNS